MLVGRDSERERLRAVAAGAAAGRGCAHAIRGEAGIGKTALLAALRDALRREQPGLSVVEACGTETESDLPFAALLQLLEPLLPLRDALPEPQRAALDGALALAPSAPGDRFTVCVAALGLLRAAAAERGPLLVLVDDAQWLDAASAECVAFAARRLAGSPVAMLVAIRSGEDVPAGLDRLDGLTLTPLAARDAAEVVAGAADGLSGGVRDAVVAAAAGNPLALIEIASSLGPAERSGRAPLPEPLPAGGRLAAVFDRRLRALGAEAQGVVLLVAAAESADLDLLGRACEAAGANIRALEEAESAALVVVDNGRVRFSHPLVRGAAWHGAAPPAQRAAHRALAAASEGDRRAWHLARSVAGPDENAAEALSEAAARAAGRRGYAEASSAYERAAALSADVEKKARRLLRACNTSIAAGQMERGLRFLDEAVALGASVSFSPRTLHTRSLLLLGIGQVDTALELLRSLTDAAEGSGDRVAAAFVAADAGMAALLVGELRELLVLGRRATALLGGGGDALVRSQVGACLAAGLVFGGEPAEGRRILEQVERDVVGIHDHELALRTHSMITHLRTALEDYETAHAHARRVLDSLDAIGAHAAKAAPVGHAADAAHRLGEWDTADAEASEAILIAEETANGDALPRALIVKARIAASRGREADARELIERARLLTDGHGNMTMQSYVLTALGLLELGLGRPEDAIAWLEQVEPIAVDRVGLVHPTILPWRPDLVEAYAMAGRMDDAAVVARKLDEEARVTGLAAGRAMAARCLGIVSEDFAAHFERALALETERPMPFERARMLLLYGTRLARARRRAEARDKLREAEAIFGKLGASPWLDRTRAELAAAGAKRRAASTRTSDELTEQELRVATTLARGMTIREAAAVLFLSPKTVESHLRQVYAKLQIHSRARLALIATERRWLE